MSCCPPPRPPRGRMSPGAIAPAPSGTAERVWADVAGGLYQVGGDDADAVVGDGEGPLRTVELTPFRIAATTVTNSEFAAFVRASGYRTDAERLGWSFVFYDLASNQVRRAARQRLAEAPWWLAVKGACWRWPAGRGSHVADRPDHPVVHVSWSDAQAYCAWSGTRLPTEAEWEVAARGGRVGTRFPWGDELVRDGQHLCNIWQGQFPDRDTAEDGFHGTAPVRSYPPNDYGLYEVAGNVWEWCQDWFTTAIEPRSGRDPRGPHTGDAKVIRGGSFLCHASYCNRYRLAARSRNTPDSASSNTGFRVAS
jgi:formylglycine-generating enzyme